MPREAETASDCIPIEQFAYLVGQRMCLTTRRQSNA